MSVPLSVDDVSSSMSLLPFVKTVPLTGGKPFTFRLSKVPLQMSVITNDIPGGLRSRWMSLTRISRNSRGYQPQVCSVMA